MIEPAADALIDVILPCLDEEEAVRWVLDRMPTKYRTTLVDNGSTDASVEVARRAGVAIQSVEKRRGAGMAVATGIRSSSRAFVCVLDCDGTIDPDELHRLVEPLLLGTADFVIGARQPALGAMTSFHRTASSIRNRILRSLFSDWHLTDVGSARAYRRDAFSKNQFTALNGRYGWTLDATLSAISAVGPQRVAEVPLSYHRRIGQSKITGTVVGALLATIDSVSVIGRHVLQRGRAKARK